MNTNLRRAVCATAFGMLALWAFAARTQTVPPRASAETSVQSWPQRSRTTALALIAKYGEPNSVEDDRLVWLNNAPWSRTVVYRAAPSRLFDLRRRAILEQSIAYIVPDDKVYELRNFDGRLRYDKASGLISSREESESRNFLALNLADDIVMERQDSTTARDFYRKTVKLSKSGKTSAYMEGFVFPISGKSWTNP